jgi:hypothetical protein
VDVEASATNPAAAKGTNLKSFIIDLNIALLLNKTLHAIVESIGPTQTQLEVAKISHASSVSTNHVAVHFRAGEMRF